MCGKISHGLNLDMNFNRSGATRFFWKITPAPLRKYFIRKLCSRYGCRVLPSWYSNPGELIVVECTGEGGVYLLHRVCTWETWDKIEEQVVSLSMTTTFR